MLQPALDTQSAARVLREVRDDVRDLRVAAVDSPGYRAGATDALAAVVSLLDAAITAATYGAECGLPGCTRNAHPRTGMCARHANVRISDSGSDVDDRHADGGHG